MPCPVSAPCASTYALSNSSPILKVKSGGLLICLCSKTHGITNMRYYSYIILIFLTISHGDQVKYSVISQTLSPKKNICLKTPKSSFSWSHLSWVFKGKTPPSDWLIPWHVTDCGSVIGSRQSDQGTMQTPLCSKMSGLFVTKKDRECSLCSNYTLRSNN